MSTSRRAALGHDVGPDAALDDADVDGDARPAPVEGVERDGQVGGCEDRAAALLGLDAGVGRPAVDRHAQVEVALARADDVAVGAGALEHEAGVHVRGPARG